MVRSSLSQVEARTAAKHVGASVADPGRQDTSVTSWLRIGIGNGQTKLETA